MSLLHFQRQRLLALFAVLVVLAGCASSPQLREFARVSAEHAEGVELQSVPFFPQRDYQCGPAALATLIAAEGVDVSPDALVPLVYIAGRQGSLQLELKAAARRYGLLPYEHAGALHDLLTQLQADQPVLVLQNLGFAWAPVWHYAVVVGYHPQRQELVLRSGRERRKRISLKEFERTWRYSDYWSLTLHEPGEIPLGAQPLAYLRSAAALESTGQLPQAVLAYRAASSQWPQEPLAWIGLGNGHYQMQDYSLAEEAYRRAANLAPQDPAPWHNLAWSLIRQSRDSEAQAFAERAVQLSGTGRTPFSSALEHLQAGQQ